MEGSSNHGSSYNTSRTLGIVAGFYNLLGISDVIDAKIPKTRHYKVTHSDVILAMVINGLCFRLDDRTIIGGEILTKKYKCTVCGYVYDPDKGDPDSGIEPGTSFEDLPDDWYCPDCGAGKEDFDEV